MPWRLPVYGLRGPQEYPYGALGLAGSHLHIPGIQEIRSVGEPLIAKHPFPRTREEVVAELDELIFLPGRRCANEIGDEFNGHPRLKLYDYLQARDTDRARFKDQHKAGGPNIQTVLIWPDGLKMTRPYLGGWMALSVLFKKHGKPPTEQEFIWAALPSMQRFQQLCLQNGFTSGLNLPPVSNLGQQKSQIVLQLSMAKTIQVPLLITPMAFLACRAIPLAPPVTAP